MKTIYKYPVSAADEFSLELPIGARVLSVQEQRGEVQLWALIDTEAPKVVYRFALRGTGHPADGLESARFIGTFQLRDGLLVFHLFERSEITSAG